MGRQSQLLLQLELHRSENSLGRIVYMQLRCGDRLRHGKSSS